METQAQRTQPSRRANIIILWTVIILLAALFGIQGTSKITSQTQAVADFAYWGYPAWFRISVGVVEVCSAIMIVIPRLSFAGTIFMIMVLLGALFTVISHAQFPQALFTLVVLALVSFVTWTRRREYVAWQKSRKQSL